MLDNLPAEISTNILHRLPVKTLIKCTTLSKDFLSLITSDEFICTRIAKNSNTHLLLRHFIKIDDGNREEKYYFEPDDENFSGFQGEGMLVPFYNYAARNWFNVMGCVNGVVCLVNDARFECTLVILWNPSIRKCVRVPKPQYVFDLYGRYESACGFGFDSMNNDYKVVRVVDLGPEYKETQLEVYSLKSGCWRFLGVGPSYSIRRGGGYIPCFLHGSIHWLGRRSLKYPIYENVILKFDVSMESFEIIEIPSVLKESKPQYLVIDYYVQVCRGMLTLINRDFDGKLLDARNCSVWIMKEYGDVKSWTKILHFKDSSLQTYGMSTLPRAFGFRNNGEVIMVKGSGGVDYRKKNLVVSIDPGTQRETILKEIIADGGSFYLSNYVESMVLFKEGKGIEDAAEKGKQMMVSKGARPKRIRPQLRRSIRRMSLLPNLRLSKGLFLKRKMSIGAPLRRSKRKMSSS